MNINELHIKIEQHEKQCQALINADQYSEYFKLCKLHNKIINHIIHCLALYVVATVISDFKTTITFKALKSKKPTPIPLLVSADPKSIPCINFL